MGDVRGDIARGLESKLSAEQISLLMDEVLAIKKRAQGEFACKKCGQRQIQVTEIPDAKGVTGALIDLANQAWGRPGEANTGDDEKIVFERVVYLTDEKPGEWVNEKKWGKRLDSDPEPDGEVAS